jgi:hypothetical protein
VVAKEEEEKPVEIEPTLNRVQSLFSVVSKVPAGPGTNDRGYTGPPKEYAGGSFQIGFRVNQNPEDFREIENRFKTIRDKDGHTMDQVCKEYWEKKRRGH